MLVQTQKLITVGDKSFDPGKVLYLLEKEHAVLVVLRGSGGSKTSSVAVYDRDLDHVTRMINKAFQFVVQS